MTEASSRHGNQPSEKTHLITWLIFPLALFPLVALLSYDWHAIPSLNTPAIPSSNLIGALGDFFAFYGYTLFGLAIWIVPIICVIGGICLLAGKRMTPGRREIWFLIFLTSVSCLIQVIGHHPGWISTSAQGLNLAAPGGVIGYLIMTKFLSPLLSDFGSSVVMSIVMILSIVIAIGLHNLIAFATALYRWATVGAYLKQVESQSAAPNDAQGQSEADRRREAYENALRAKEAAKLQREQEKEAARAAKQAEKEAKLKAKAEAKEAERIARENILREREAAEAAARRSQDTFVRSPEPQPQPAAPAAVRMPARDLVEETTDTASTEENKGPYILPSVALLDPLKASTADHSDVGETSQRLISTLKLFGVDAQLSYTVQGPVVTKYAIELAPGTRYSAVTNLEDNLKGALHAKSLRIEAPIPGEDRIGIEVPNLKPAGITFREIFESDAWKNSKAELPLLFGKRADGKELVADLASMPHMLVAGATGQGKSVCLNSLINGLLMTRTPEELKLIMVDPKCVEFTPYSSIPHLLVPVITDNRKVVFSLHWAVAEMEKRLKMFARAKVRNIYDFNHRLQLRQTDMFGNDSDVTSDLPRTVPYIVIIIDEAADLIGQCGKDVNPDIQRITQKARAAGIHLILATQRPDAKIITGAIKANIPGRVAFKTSSSVDSRTILDDTGAENLIGKGDMLFRGKDGLLIRAQGAWISDREIASITSFIEEHSSLQFDEKFATKLGRVKEAAIEDPFASNEDDPDNQAPQGNDEPTAAQMKAAAGADDFKKAVECIIETKRASTSHFQRRLGWGYNHAAKIMDKLESAGIIGPQQGAGPRPIIMDQDQLVAILNGGGADSVVSQTEDENAPIGEEDLVVSDGSDNGEQIVTEEEL